MSTTKGYEGEIITNQLSIYFNQLICQLGNGHVNRETIELNKDLIFNLDNICDELDLDVNIRVTEYEDLGYLYGLPLWKPIGNIYFPTAHNEIISFYYIANGTKRFP